PGDGMKNSPGTANVLRFEDKAGAEQLWLHAQKDQLTEVENNETKWVGANRTKDVDGNETNTIGQNRTELVQQNETITIVGTRDETVLDNELLKIKDNRTHTIKKDAEDWIGQDHQMNVGRHVFLEAGETFTITCGECLFHMTKEGKVVIKGNQFLLAAMEADGIILTRSGNLQLNPDGYDSEDLAPHERLGDAVIKAQVENTFPPKE
ncbi:bacteriophage T4 gp5 trimerisation domain-containing protein, partial [Delftia tsuruhatensis]